MDEWSPPFPETYPFGPQMQEIESNVPRGGRPFERVLSVLTRDAERSGLTR